MQKMHLLNRAEQCGTQDAQVWFRDGIRLIKASPALWAGVSLAGIGISLAALILGGIFSAISPLLVLIPIIAAQLFVQAGMLIICAYLAAQEKAEIGQFFNALNYMKVRGIWQLGLFLLLLDVVFSALQNLLFPQPLLWIENEQLQMAEKAVIYQALAFMACSQTVILFCTWALLPLLVEFPEQNFMKILRLQFDGVARNLMPLLLFSLLCLATMSGVFFLLLLIGKLSSVLFFALLITIVLWGWPLLTAWTFSAVRHIFMDW